jgi:hypothetical protein
MFVPLELVNEMRVYMGNDDLISMSLACRDWNPTCARHLSVELEIDTFGSFGQGLQDYLDNFDGCAQHPDLPTDPNHITSIRINMILYAKTNKAADFATMYALLGHLSHVHCLKLHAELYEEQLSKLKKVCRNIHARLLNIKHLTLSTEWIFDDDEDAPSEGLYQIACKHIVGNYKLTNLLLWYGDWFDATTVLNAQASTLVELEVPFLIVAQPTSGLHLTTFPRLKKWS